MSCRRPECSGYPTQCCGSWIAKRCSPGIRVCCVFEPPRPKSPPGFTRCWRFKYDDLSLRSWGPRELLRFRGVAGQNVDVSDKGARFDDWFLCALRALDADHAALDPGASRIESSDHGSNVGGGGRNVAALLSPRRHGPRPWVLRELAFGVGVTFRNAVELRSRIEPIVGRNVASVVGQLVFLRHEKR